MDETHSMEREKGTEVPCCLTQAQRKLLQLLFVASGVYVHILYFCFWMKPIFTKDSPLEGMQNIKCMLLVLTR